MKAAKLQPGGSDNKWLVGKAALSQAHDFVVEDEKCSSLLSTTSLILIGVPAVIGAPVLILCPVTHLLHSCPISMQGNHSNHKFTSYYQLAMILIYQGPGQRHVCLANLQESCSLMKRHLQRLKPVGMTMMHSAPPCALRVALNMILSYAQSLYQV